MIKGIRVVSEESKGNTKKFVIEDYTIVLDDLLLRILEQKGTEFIVSREGGERSYFNEM